MKLLSCWEVLYYKLPEKKRNHKFDGIVKVFETKPSVTIFLYSINPETVISKKVVGVSENLNLQLDSVIQIGPYMVTIDSSIDDFQNIDDNVTSHQSDKKQESPQKTKITSISQDNLQTALRKPAAISSLSRTIGFRPPTTIPTIKRETKENERNEYELPPLKYDQDDFDTLILSSSSDSKTTVFPLKRFISHSSSSTEPHIESRVELDRTIRKRMRPHQVVAAEWILNCFENKINTSGDIFSSETEEDFIIVNGKKKSLLPKSFDEISEKPTENFSKVRGCLLFDEMGLGKTLTSIAVIWSYIQASKKSRILGGSRAIVVCPSSLIDNWDKEFKKWIGVNLQTMTVKVNSASKRQPMDIIKSFAYCTNSTVLIISYEMYRKYCEILNTVTKVQVLVCDEGHRLKNIDGTKTIAALSHSLALRRMILSGTPIQNDLDELYSLVSFVQPGLLASVSTFQTQFSIPISRGNLPNASNEERHIRDEANNKLRKLLQSIMLRRTQQEVLAKFLPPRVDLVVYCNLTSSQLQYYREVASNIYNILNISSATHGYTKSLMKGDVNEDKYQFIPNENSHVSNIAMKRMSDISNTTVILPQLLQLRQICNNISITSGMSSIQQSCKYQVLESLITRILVLKPVEKVVIVSNFIDTLDDVEALVRSKGLETLRLDGTVPAEKRQGLVNCFNNISDKHRIFLLSSKAGGVGINLIGGSRLIMMDCDWNPAIDHQAMARIWREGQTKTTFVYRLIASNVIEDAILDRQAVKSKLLSLIEVAPAIVHERRDDQSGDIKKSNVNKKGKLDVSDVIELIQPAFPAYSIEKMKKKREEKIFSDDESSDSEMSEELNQQTKEDSDEQDIQWSEEEEFAEEETVKLLNHLKYQNLIDRFSIKTVQQEVVNVSDDTKE